MMIKSEVGQPEEARAVKIACNSNKTKWYTNLDTGQHCRDHMMNPTSATQKTIKHEINLDFCNHTIK